MKLPLSIRVGRVVGGGDEGYITLEITDEKSGILFTDIEMSFEDYGKLVAASAAIKVEGEIRNTENLGKTYKHETRSVTITGEEAERLSNAKYADQKKAYAAYLEANCREEGWHLDTYLGAQNSVQGSGGWNGEPRTIKLNYRVFRWV